MWNWSATASLLYRNCLNNSLAESKPFSQQRAQSWYVSLQESEFIFWKTSMSIRTLFLTFAFLVLCLPVAQAFELRGMDGPASFIVDSSTGTHYVSNVAGLPRAKDGIAYIAKIDSQGKLIDRDFIRSGRNGVSLNAPKGLAISGDDLFVSDIDVVRRLDKNSGKLLGVIDLALLGAKFLNGLALSPDGQLFVSDTIGNVIFKIDLKKNHRVTILASGAGLGHPNGMVYENRHHRLLVTTSNSGKIIAVDMRGQLLTVYRGDFKDLDGIDLDGQGDMIVSDFAAGKIVRIKKYSSVEVLRKNMVTPAGISFDARTNRVLVPSFAGNLVFTFSPD
jgi:DNA-binding beta-propeller fold protein YncE